MNVTAVNGRYIVEVKGMLNGISFHFAAQGDSQRDAMNKIKKPYSDFMDYARGE